MKSSSYWSDITSYSFNINQSQLKWIWIIHLSSSSIGWLLSEVVGSCVWMGDEMSFMTLRVTETIAQKLLRDYPWNDRKLRKRGCLTTWIASFTRDWAKTTCNQSSLKPRWTQIGVHKREYMARRKDTDGKFYTVVLVRIVRLCYRKLLKCQFRSVNLGLWCMAIQYKSLMKLNMD